MFGGAAWWIPPRGVLFIYLFNIYILFPERERVLGGASWWIPPRGVLFIYLFNIYILFAERERVFGGAAWWIPPRGVLFISWRLLLNPYYLYAVAFYFIHVIYTLAPFTSYVL